MRTFSKLRDRNPGHALHPASPQLKKFEEYSHEASHEAERCKRRSTSLRVDVRHEVALEARRRQQWHVLAHRVVRATLASALLQLLGLHLRVDREALSELGSALVDKVHVDGLLLDVDSDNNDGGVGVGDGSWE